VDLRHFLRLGEARRELQEVRECIERSPEAEVATALRPALDKAIGALQKLYDDESVWTTAQDAVRALPTTPLAQVRDDFATSLPPLLDLFGYECPPPPSAQQLVRETVGLIDAVGNGESLAEEVAAARSSLHQLLERSSELPRDPPWMLAQEATEVNGFLDLGIQVALGSGAGAAAVAFATIAGGAVTGGIAPVAGCIVVGGVRRFQQVRAIRGEADRLAREHVDLTAHVFSASSAAVLQYLDEVIALSTKPGRTEDPSADLKVSADLDALIDIARRFVIGDPRLPTVVNQSRLKYKNAPPGRLMPLFREVHRVANQVRAKHARSGTINTTSSKELEQLRDSLRNVLEQADR
jgi:hypothetical protein